MSQYQGSVCKLCRSEKKKLFLKGSRCNTVKCAVSKKPYPPGQHGQMRKKQSEHGLHLREKQKVKRTYGLLEKQFRNIFKKASNSKGVTGTILLQSLELRFDNIVFRSGLALSRGHARQLISHKHFMIDGKRVNVPSYVLKPGQTVTVKTRSQDLIKQILMSEMQLIPPQWLAVNTSDLIIKVDRVPEREDIDPEIKEQLVIEYYSR